MEGGGEAASGDDGEALAPELCDEIERLCAAHWAAADAAGAHVVALLDSFTVIGPHGAHAAMVFELLGPTLLAELQTHGPLPADAARRAPGYPPPLLRRARSRRRARLADGLGFTERPRRRVRDALRAARGRS